MIIYQVKWQDFAKMAKCADPEVIRSVSVLFALANFRKLQIFKHYLGTHNNCPTWTACNPFKMYGYILKGTHFYKVNNGFLFAPPIKMKLLLKGRVCSIKKQFLSFKRTSCEMGDNFLYTRFISCRFTHTP